MKSECYKSPTWAGSPCYRASTRVWTRAAFPWYILPSEEGPGEEEGGGEALMAGDSMSANQNADDGVDVSDIVQFVEDMALNPVAADVNGDGVVDANDVETFFEYIGGGQ